MNKTQNLNSGWYIVTDANNSGKTNNYQNNIPSGAVNCNLPSVIQQYFPDYHGVCWYYLKFTPEIYVDKTDLIKLCFGGVDYKAEVWINGNYLGADEGGETPFTFDVTNFINLNAENLIAVRVINPIETEIDGFTYKSVPHRNKETFKQAGCNLNHGGMWYGVELCVTPNSYISDRFIDAKISGNLNANVTISTNISEEDAELILTVYDTTKLNGIVAKKSTLINLNKGDNVVNLSVDVANVNLWDVDNPNLYLVEITLNGEYGKHTVVNKKGFREFKVENGYFYLNGKKTFLKCAHTGNVYPVGQMVPTHIEQLRQDLIYAKASGFNTVRAISGMFRPEQIALADEIGMLLYEECFASWCMGYSNAIAWKNDDEYIKVQNKYSVPLGAQEDMSKRWENATAKMIQRDKNATSIVAWGLLNETFESSISKTAIAFLPKLREIDNSRLVILSSGRWELDFSVGSVSNPYSNKWNNVWGNDGVLETVNNPDANLVGDMHYYPQAPIKEECVNKIRTMGHNTVNPVFFSEFGVGAQFNVIEEYKHFVQYGERDDLEDGAWLKLQSEQFTNDFYRLNLNKVYPFPEKFLKDSQRLNADERKRHFDMIRSNNRLCGYSLTGLFDHGMCGEGLWSYWRRWKPEMFDAVSDGWAKLRFCNFVDINSYEGNGITIESVLANDGILKSGTYTANFAITDDYGVYYTFTETFNLNENDFATPIFKRKINLNLQEGKYYLTAELNEGSPVGTTTHFYVYDKIDGSALNKVYVYGLSEGELDGLNKLNINFNKYNGESSGLLLVGANNVNVEELLNKANEGLTVAFIDAELFKDDKINAFKGVISDVKLTNHHDWLYHKEYMLADAQIFNGLGSKILELPRFVNVYPHLAINTNITPNYVICPAFLTGYYGVKTGYELNYGMLGVNVGKGKIILSTFEILNNLGLPVADKLLINLIKKFNN